MLYSGVDEAWLALSPQAIKCEHQQGPQMKIPNVLEYNFEVRHPRCVCSVTKNFCVLHIQPNTTIIHLVVQYVYNYMFRPYMLAIFRFWFNLQSSYARCVGCSFRVLGVGWGERDLALSIVLLTISVHYSMLVLSILTPILLMILFITYP